MEDEINKINGLGSDVVGAVPNRPMSPVENLVGGVVDGRPLESSGNPLENMFLATLKLVKGALKDNLAAKEKKKLLSTIEAISTMQVKDACENPYKETMKKLTSFDDFTLKKVPAPRIHEGAADNVSTRAYKDFSVRTHNGHFSSTRNNNIHIRDLLTAVTEVAEIHNLSYKAVTTLLKWSMRGSARTFLDNLLDSEIDLNELYEQLQENFIPRIEGPEASKKLGELLHKPIENLDTFLTDVLNFSIATQKSLPVKYQSSSGQLLANSSILEYLQRIYPTVFAVLLPDIRRAQANCTKPEELFRALMQLLRAHRSALESTSKRVRISEVIGQIPSIEPENDPQPENQVQQAIEALSTNMKELHGKFDSLQSARSEGQGFVQEVRNQSWAPGQMNLRKTGGNQGDREFQNYSRPKGYEGQQGSFQRALGPQLPRRRLLMSAEEYQKHFSNGNCFKCGLKDHSYRECPHVPQRLSDLKCPSCYKAHIVAYHNDCNGNIEHLHKKLGRGTPVSEVFYPEEGPLVWHNIEESGPTEKEIWPKN